MLSQKGGIPKQIQILGAVVTEVGGQPGQLQEGHVCSQLSTEVPDCGGQVSATGHFCGRHVDQADRPKKVQASGRQALDIGLISLRTSHKTGQQRQTGSELPSISIKLYQKTASRVATPLNGTNHKFPPLINVGIGRRCNRLQARRKCDRSLARSGRLAPRLHFGKAFDPLSQHGARCADVTSFDTLLQAAYGRGDLDFG